MILLAPVFNLVIKNRGMSEDILHFSEKLCALLANDENIVAEKLEKYLQ